MVKPPRTMEPSAVSNMKKAGRDHIKAFSDDSFHTYMARKIDMQRKQFGTILHVPPPPLPPLPPLPLPQSLPQSSSISSPSTHKISQTFTTTTTNYNKHCHDEQNEMNDSVDSYIDNDIDSNKKQNTEALRLSSATTRKNEKTKKKGKGKQFGVSAIVKRLQQKHRVHHSSTTIGTTISAATKAAIPTTPPVAARASAADITSIDPSLGSTGSEPSAGRRKRSRSPTTTRTVEINESNNYVTDQCYNDPQPRHLSEHAVTTRTEMEIIATTATSAPFHSSSSQHDCKYDVDSTNSDTINDSFPRSLTSNKYRKMIRPDLFFSDIVIFVNGYTDPDNETLQRLIQKHGGDIERYETTRVTHIIAQQLSLAKANVYKKMKQQYSKPIVTPNWIMDSIQSFKLLPYQNYILKDVKLCTNVPSVASLFQQQREQQVSTLRVTTNSTSAVNENLSTLPPNKTMKEQDDPQIKTNLATRNMKSTVKQMVEESSEVMISEPINNYGKGGYMKNGTLRTIGTDPNFLESFFASSRLSFIGSYRQRSSTTNSCKPRPSNMDTNTKVGERLVFHVDMDCFFASVVLRNYPQYQNLPVVISHNGKTTMNDSDTKQQPQQVEQKKQLFLDSSSECATCNYEARKFGIKKGMFLGRAKTLCPNLIVLPYDYEGYEEVSDIVSQILDRYAALYNGYIEQVSCDEAYMELFIPNNNKLELPGHAMEIAESIRQEIFSMTKCTASVGVGPNKFLAKVGTDRVKPNQSYYVQDFRLLLKDMKLRDMYGIGYKMSGKLEMEGLSNVQDIWDLNECAESELCKILGPGLGKKVFGYCNGIDDRTIQATERKSIGAECNYGVRFDGPFGVDHMIEGLCKEVEKRMTHVGVKGLKVTLKMKQRKNDASPPYKFLGHGSCHNLSKTSEIINGNATRSWKSFYEIAMELYRELKVCKEDVRGMGIVISKLVDDSHVDTSNISPHHTIAKWLHAKKNDGDQNPTPRKVNFLLPTKSTDDDLVQLDADESVDIDESSSSSEVLLVDSTMCNDVIADNSDIVLPSISQIHMSQVNELPSPMRKQIILKLETEKYNKEVPQVLDNRQLSTSTRDVRFRQVDVKRMFRLASVKSGKAAICDGSGQAISLTQLDCLPLDLQLEIANEDSNGIGIVTSPEKRSGGRNYVAQDRTKKSPPTKQVQVQYNDMQQCGNDSNNSKNSKEADAPKFCKKDSNFVRDNVIPLVTFLDENPNVDVESIGHVTEFLCICVSENRLSDTVLLLKTIKQHRSCWSVVGFDTIFDIVNQQVLQCYRACLDKEWVVNS